MSLVFDPKLRVWIYFSQQVCPAVPKMSRPVGLCPDFPRSQGCKLIPPNLKLDNLPQTSPTQSQLVLCVSLLSTVIHGTLLLAEDSWANSFSLEFISWETKWQGSNYWGRFPFIISHPWTPTSSVDNHLPALSPFTFLPSEMEIRMKSVHLASGLPQISSLK